MKKITSPPKKINPFTWRSIKSVRIKSHDPGCDLTAEEFVKRIRTNPGYYDDDLILARDILLQLCAIEVRTAARVARLILEKAGYRRPIIPKEAYLPHSTDNFILKEWKRHPATLIAGIEFVLKRIKPIFHGRRLKSPDATREAFKSVVHLDMTAEDMQNLRKWKANTSRVRLAIFFYISSYNHIFEIEDQFQPESPRLSYATACDIYKNARKERKERMDAESLTQFLINSAQPDSLGFLEGIFWP